MEEQLIEYKTAVLAHKKKFQTNIGLGYKQGDYYTSEGILNGDVTPYIKEMIKAVTTETLTPKSDLIAAPTQSKLQRWLRKTHDIHIEIQLDRTSYPKYCFEIYKYSDFGNYESLKDTAEWFLYKSYEEALEEALYQSLKSI